MRKLFISIFLILPFLSWSQDSIITIKRTYIPIAQFRKLGIALPPKDNGNYRFHNGDTLVEVDPQKLPDDGKYKVKVPYEFKDSAFLKTYEEVVFPNKNSTLKIWKDDIKMYFAPGVPETHEKALMDFAEGLSAAVDSLNIYKVTNPEDSNYIVYYLNTPQDSVYEKRIANPYADFYVNWNRRQELYKGYIQINAMKIHSKKVQLADLKYEFFRSLGFFSGSDLVKCNDYLSNCRIVRNLTSKDMEILKYHYSYGICKGTNKESFEETHRNMKKILAEDPNAKVYIVHTY